MSRLKSRAALAAATTALALGISGTLVSPASAEPASDAAGWLSGQLTDGLLTYDSGYGDYTDVGLTIDAGLAFAELGRTAEVAALKASVAAKVDGYAFADETEFDPPYAFVQKGLYAPQIAKVMVWAQTAGADPRSYGGTDLVAALEALTSDSGPSAGRIKSDSSYGDYSNTIGQALAARGLTVAGSPEAAKAVSYLLKQQCTPGYFRDSLSADDTADNQSCVDGDATTSAPAIDATAYAVLMLSATKSTDPTVVSALDKARTWLSSARAADGSYVSGDALANANSTGLATWALAGTDCVALGRSANWLRALQVPATATGELAKDKGAVAFDKAAFTAAANGIDPLTAGQWARVTAQAAPALRHTLSPTLTAFGGPTGYVRAGTAVSLKATGVSAGENLCVTLPGQKTTSVRATGDTVSLDVTLPAGTANTTYTIAYAGGERQATVSTLGALKIKPKLKKTVKRGKKQVVKVTGLAPGESVKVKVGKITRKGTATSAGTFKAKVKIKKNVKRGKVKVKVKGQFPKTRSGSATFKVR